MRKLNVRVVLLAAFCAAAWSLSVPELHADTAVRCTQNGPNQTVCRIDEPNVKQRLTDYRQVTFHAGDVVTVAAGGCVQTGGSGATWKRYVNPSGPNSNRLYWGTISIPGATTGTVRISDVTGHQLTVAPGVPDSNAYLRLGYLDDDYGDNGYWGHDDGTENQCRGVGNAFVVVTINHPAGVANSCGGTTGNSPLDLVWTDCDPNGFPLNPRFRYQVEHNGLVPPPPSEICASGFGSSCTSWPLSNDSGAFCGPHRNWFAATYQAPIDWEDKSKVGTDDDYNYRMFPAHDEGVLTHPDLTINGFEIEFDSDETIDHFTSPLWSSFHSQVDNNNNTAQAEVKSKMAVVTGLFGLDCGHPSCSSELHPAYVMAVDMDNSNPGNDTWAVFARNWGDEGYCSDDQHDLPVTDLKLQIPWPAGATNVIVGPDTQFYVFSNSGSNAAVPSPRITFAVGQGVLIDFGLPDPGTQMGVEGELHLQWTFSSMAARIAMGRPVTGGTRRGNINREETEKPEMHVGALISQMNASQMQTFRARLKSSAVPHPAITRRKLTVSPAVKVAALPRPPRLARPLAAQMVTDQRLVKRSEATKQGLCEAYKGQVPGYPKLCSPHPVFHLPTPISH
jgi:hypothetical protein